MEWWQTLGLVLGGLLLGSAGAYLLANNRGARDVASAVLIAARQVVAGYLQEHPPDAGALNGIIAGGYYALPPKIQARVSLETFEKLVLPLLYQAEAALVTPPPAGERALLATPGGDDSGAGGGLV